MSDNRPTPLHEVAAKVGVAWAALSTLVGALVTFGVFTAAQGDAVQAAGTALPGGIEAIGVILGGLIPAFGALIAAFHTASVGKDHVTPLSAPQDAHGTPLVPADNADPFAGGAL